MKRTFFLLLLAGISLTACRNASSPSEILSARIAFGSCAHQDKEQPLLKVAASLQPDVFVFLGDNIYGDSRDMDTLRAKYAKLAAKEEFRNLFNQTRVLAVWDDHDYGENDSGRHYPYKAESKEIFMDFWKVPAGSERRKHEGIYGVETLEAGGKRIQFILLDTRTFRDNLILRDSTDTAHKNDYAPNQDPDSTFLGAAQWQWLEQQLSAEADVRIIVSSNQFSHSYNGWESWTNVPHERQRLIDLIKKTKANGVIFISGDVHWGEISRLEVAGGYPLYDLTSSGITETWDVIEPNDNRIGEPVPQNNVGLIEITTRGDSTQLTLAIYDATGRAVVEHKVGLEELGF